MSNTREITCDIEKDSSYEKRLIKYLFQCIACEGSKIILFAIFFCAIHRFGEFLMALFMLLLLRTNGGGLHLQHYISCLALSFAVLSASVLLAAAVPIPALLLKAILLFCIAPGYRLVPILSVNRPPADDKLVQKSKRNTLLIISGYFILICIVPDNLYLRIGSWTIVLHILQLFTAKFL